MISELSTAFGLGIVATLSPCALPLYPGFLAYLAAGRERLGPPRSLRWLGLFVLLGVLTMMLALGAVIASLSLAVGRVLVFVTPVAYAVVIALGLAMILGRNPFARLPQLGTTARGGPLLTAYGYGLLYGPIALPCSGPLIVSIFALSLTVGSFVDKLLFFLAFGLGFGLPLLLLSAFAPARSAWLLRALAARQGILTRAAGALVAAVAGVGLIDALPAIVLYLAP